MGALEPAALLRSPRPDFTGPADVERYLSTVRKEDLPAVLASLSAFAAADHAPQLVVAQGVAAVEVPDAVGTVIGRRQPVRACAAGPAGAVAWADRQRPELVEGETAV